MHRFSSDTVHCTPLLRLLLPLLTARFWVRDWSLRGGAVACSFRCKASELVRKGGVTSPSAAQEGKASRGRGAGHGCAAASAVIERQATSRQWQIPY